MEGGDTNCYLLIWGSSALEMSRYNGRPQGVDADLLSRAVLGRRSLLFAFLFFPPNRGRPEQVDGGRECRRNPGLAKYLGFTE